MDVLVTLCFASPRWLRALHWTFLIVIICHYTVLVFLRLCVCVVHCVFVFVFLCA